MFSSSYHTDLSEKFSELAMKLRDFAEGDGGLGGDEVLSEIGRIVKFDIQDRIRSKKMSPQGEKWAPWSPRYARTRTAGQSLLFSTGALMKSVDYGTFPAFREVNIGSDLDYAAPNDKTREFIGISDLSFYRIEQALQEGIAAALSEAMA